VRWWHDELELRKIDLELRASHQQLSLFERLVYSSFDLDDNAISDELTACDAARAAVLASIIAADAERPAHEQRDPSRHGTAADLAIPVQVKTSKDGPETIYPTTEAAGIALGVQTGVVNQAISHGSHSFGSGQVMIARRVPNSPLAGEFLIAESHLCPWKATIFTTAGRVSAGPKGHLRFGRKMADEDGIERRYLGEHQVARAILLALDPPPGDPKDFEVDHINTNALDNRLCNLQWMRVRNGKRNEHADKNAHERGQKRRS